MHVFLNEILTGVFEFRVVYGFKSMKENRSRI